MESIINFISTPFFEEYNKWLGLAGLIFGIALFIVYNRAVFLNYGWLKSISISYYSVKPHWLFQMFMWGSILAILCIGQNVMYFLVGVFFGIMTCNPTVNGGNIYFIPHIFCAITAITLSLLGLYIVYNLNYYFWFCVITLLISYICIHKKFNCIYIIEILSLTLLIIGFLIMFLLQL